MRRRDAFRRGFHAHAGKNAPMSTGGLKMKALWSISMIAVALLLTSVAVVEEVEAHGRYVGPYSETYDFLGCCGDSRASLQITRRERYYVDPPTNPNPIAPEQAPGRHWHTTIRTECVDRSNLAYRSQCDTYKEVCRDVWVRESTPFKKCAILDGLCHIRAGNRYENVSWERVGLKYHYYRWNLEEICEEVLVP